MQAITNLKGNGKIPDGKSVDLQPVREFVEETNVCSIQDAIKAINESQMPDMNFDELKGWLRCKFNVGYTVKNRNEGEHS